VRIGLLVAFAALSCVGCTVLTSETIDQLAGAKRAPRGVQYALPRGTVVAKLDVEPATLAFILGLEPGEVVPDRHHEYVLRYQPNASYDDDILIKTNDKGLLTSVETTTEDRTPGVIVNIAKALAAFGRLEAAEQEKQITPLLTRAFDPFDPNQRAWVTEEINRRIVGYIETALKSCRYVGNASGTAARRMRDVLEPQSDTAEKEVARLQQEKSVVDAAVKAAIDKAAEVISSASQIKCPSAQPPELKLACDLLERQSSIARRLSSTQTALTKLETAIQEIKTQEKARKPVCDALAGLKNKPPKAQIALPDHPDLPEYANTSEKRMPRENGASTDCTIGLCYRPIESVRIVYSLGGGDETLVVDLPHPTDLVAIDIKRAFFVKKIQKMTFDRGVLTKLQIDKKSELVAISKIPIDVIGAIAEGIRFRVSVKTEEKNILDKEAALLKAQASLAEARAQSHARGPLESKVGPAPPTRPIGATSRPVLP
jgi:hypothetical protein